MSQPISKLTYQVNLFPNLIIKKDCYNPTYFHSPTLSINDNMFWRLVIEFKGEFYRIFLKPVAGLNEITWGKRSKLSFKIFVKEIGHHKTTYNSNIVIPPDTDINVAYECPFTSFFQSEELKIGITFHDIEYIEYKENGICNYPKPITKNLINAWKDQLLKFQPTDIEFSIQDKKFYACSSILSKRSEYFANILSGQWAESAILQNEEQINQNETSNECVNNNTENNLENSLIYDGKDDDSVNDDLKNDDRSKFQIKHHIEISDCDPIVFLIMLEYLYTDQIEWNSKGGESITIKLFCLADKYLLTDLREQAKIKIICELNISNVSDIMFHLVPKYEDLKEPVLKFMAGNLEEVSNSQEFKDILTNLVNFPNYHMIISEILAEHFKIQKAK